MKKIFIFSLAALLTLAYGLAYAQAPAAPVLDFKASGYLNTEYTLGRNVRPNIRFAYHTAPPGEFNSDNSLDKNTRQVNVQCQYGQGIEWNHLF